MTRKGWLARRLAEGLLGLWSAWNRAGHEMPEAAGSAAERPSHP